MRELRAALRQALEAQGLPVYELDGVPAGCARPHLTFRLRSAAPGCAVCDVRWHGEADAEGAAERLTELRGLFPERGALLRRGGLRCLVRPTAWACGRDRADPRLRTAALRLEVTVLGKPAEAP